MKDGSANNGRPYAAAGSGSQLVLSAVLTVDDKGGVGPTSSAPERR